MSQIALKSRYKKTYDEGITQAVGPTTATGQRPDRSELNPDTGNSVFVAPNGNDLNPGTEASPYLTIAVGLAALTGGNPNLILMRNGYVGDLIWTSAASYTIPAGMNMQAEEGEIAYLHMVAVGAGAPRIFMSASSKMDGVEVLYNWTTPSIYELIDITDNDCVVTNCQFGRTIAVGSLGAETKHPDYLVTAIGGVTIATVSHCLFVYTAPQFDGVAPYEPAKPLQVTHDPGMVVTNCIFTGQLTPAAGSAIGHTGTVGGLATVTRCLFWGYEQAVAPRAGTIGTPSVLSLDKCVVLNCSYVIGTSGVGADYYEINTSFCYLLPSTAMVSDALNVTLTISDALDTAIPPLFIDQQAGQDGNPSGWRIQMEGRLVDGTTNRYRISSPLYQVSGGVDANPWEEFVTLIAASYQDTILLSAYTPALAGIQIIPQGSVQLHDINGNLYTDYDGIRKTFELKWTAPPRISDANDARKLQQMMLDKGTKLFYPLGLTGNMFQPTSMAGTFTGSSLEIDLTADQYHDMIPGWWQGLYMELDGKDWYIIDNDENIVYLANPLGNSVPADANYSLAVRYMIVQNELVPIAMTQGDYFTRFLNGGQYAEKSDDETQPFEWHGFTAKFTEVATSREG